MRPKYFDKKRVMKRESQRRRRQNKKASLDVGMQVPIISGKDTTRWPAAYCTHYRGFLTVNLMKLHNCEGKHCVHCKLNVADYLDV